MPRLLRIPLFTLSLGSLACGQEDPASDEAGDEASETGTTDDTGETADTTGDPLPESHSKGTPNYDLVFDDTVVRRMDIVITPADWALMTADLASLYGGGGGGMGSFPDQDPIYVPVTLDYEGETWAHVGMRFKGNSSLAIAYQQGNAKLPFRLHFDKYEDEFPEILDQRFWGFKELKFSSGAMDTSVLRDKLAADVFREAGVPAAKGAFLRVHVDVGTGPIYWGLYSMFEDPCGSLLDSWFGDDAGNCYKPDGDAASWASADLTVFEKQTNETAADFSDIEATYAALHGGSGAAWRDELEAHFDVDGFLRYLALNNLIQNWDSYGRMTHNYYLYGDPADASRLVWIPWDNNESFNASTGGGGGGGGGKTVLSLTMDEVTDAWPMIRYLMDDPVYAGQYYAHLQDLTETSFTPTKIGALAQTYHDLIAPYVIGAEGELAGSTFTTQSAFESSVSGDILPTLTARYDAAQALLP